MYKQNQICCSDQPLDVPQYYICGLENMLSPLKCCNIAPTTTPLTPPHSPEGPLNSVGSFSPNDNDHGKNVKEKI